MEKRYEDLTEGERSAIVARERAAFRAGAGPTTTMQPGLLARAMHEIVREQRERELIRERSWLVGQLPNAAELVAAWASSSRGMRRAARRNPDATNDLAQRVLASSVDCGLTVLRRGGDRQQAYRVAAAHAFGTEDY